MRYQEIASGRMAEVVGQLGKIIAAG
jgi:hypothetical protein